MRNAMRAAQSHHDKEGDLYYDVLDGWRIDAGRLESLFLANQLVARARGAEDYAGAASTKN